MAGPNLRTRTCSAREYRFVVVVGVAALAITSIPYVLGAALATEDRVFGGFVYAVEDGYSYLAKMRQGAEGGWLFHIAYTPEPHLGTLFFPFHLLLGKLAALLPGGDLTARLVWIYHGARWVFGLVLLLTVYRFLARFTGRVAERRLAWLLVTFGGGLGWLLIALGRPGWLGSMPLDFILPEGFTFLALYAFPHIALARTLLLWGILFLLRAWESSPKCEVRRPDHASRITHHTSSVAALGWAALAGFLWLAMGLIVPFYVTVAWAVIASAWAVLGLRRRRMPWREGLVVGLAVIVSAPIVVYSSWVFTADPVHATWAVQNRILSPHPFHYLTAYGMLLALGAFAIGDVWRGERMQWLALSWLAVVPVLVYLPFNLQRRLVEGVQVPLSLLAALGISKWRLQGLRQRVVAGALLIALSLTNVMLVIGNCLALQGQPAPIYRDAAEIAALDWLARRVESDDVVLVAYETGNYLPARVGARAFVGHGPESVRPDEKKAQVARFFNAATADAWRQQLLAQYSVDYVVWGPMERALGDFDLGQASYLRLAFDAGAYAVFEVAD